MMVMSGSHFFISNSQFDDIILNETLNNIIMVILGSHFMNSLLELDDILINETF